MGLGSRPHLVEGEGFDWVEADPALGATVPDRSAK